MSENNPGRIVEGIPEDELLKTYAGKYAHLFEVKPRWTYSPSAGRDVLINTIRYYFCSKVLKNEYVSLNYTFTGKSVIIRHKLSTGSVFDRDVVDLHDPNGVQKVEEFIERAGKRGRGEFDRAFNPLD